MKLSSLAVSSRSSTFASLAAVAALSLGGAPAHADEPKQRHTLDEQDLGQLAEQSSEASRSFAEGERLLKIGQLAEAEAAFAKVRQLAPKVGLPARRHAQVLSELGRRRDAVAACQDALTYGRSPIDARACVGAQLSGPAPVSMQEMADAVRLMHWAGKLPTQPFGDAAACDVAYRLGDEGMLSHCQAGLQKIAPDHYETKRWSAVVLPSEGLPRGLGWLAVGGVGLASLAHFARRRLSLERGRVALATVLAFSLASSAASAETPPATVGTATAETAPAGSAEEPRAGVQRGGTWQLSKQFPIDPNDPEKGIPSEEARNKSPLEFGYYLQDLAAEAAYAERKQDYAKAARFWAALGKTVTDVSIGLRRACKAYEAAGDSTNAIAQCREILARPDVQLDDFGQQARLLLAKPQLEPTDLAELEEMIAHLRRDEAQPAAGLAGAHLSCELGARLEDVGRMAACTSTLAKAAPNDPKTLVFQWTYAMLRKDYGDARDRLAALKKTKIEPAALAKLETATSSSGTLWSRLRSDWRYGVTLSIALFTLALVLAVRRRKQHPSVATPTAARV